MSTNESDLRLASEYLARSFDGDFSSAFAGTAPLVWIGTGLGKISASYGSSLVHQLTGRTSSFVTPLQFCHSAKSRCIPILVSLRGSNPDVFDTACCIGDQRPRRAVFITADPHNPSVARIPTDRTELFVASGPLPPRDTRFINLNSVIVLSALTDALIRAAVRHKDQSRISEDLLATCFYRTGNAAVDVARRISETEDWQSRHFIILADGIASPLALAWSSILAEAGVATASVTDIKDYTHGDHAAAVLHGNIRFIIIRHSSTSVVADIFYERFSTRFPVSMIQLEHSGALLFWENLFFAASVTSALSHALGYRGDRPPRDTAVHQWRGWGSVRSKSET